MCKKQKSFSHISNESEVISSDASLRMDGIPALDLWDLVVEVRGVAWKLPICSTSLDISQFASGHLSSTISCQTMSKRLTQQERPGEDERVVAKSKPMWNMVSKTVDRSPTALGSSASYSLETLKAKSSDLDLTSTWKPVSREASSSQVRQSDVKSSSSAGKLAAETTKNPLTQDCFTTT